MSKLVQATVPRATGPATNDRVAKIGLYRECMRLAQLAEPTLKGKSMIAEVRDTWRQHRGHGGLVLEASIALCLDRISYGRMCLCKQRLKLIPAASEKYEWKVKNPMDNHAKYMRRHENQSAGYGPGAGNRDFVPHTNWGFGNLDPDVKLIHKKTMDEHFFMGPKWRNRPKPINMDDLSFEEGAAMYARGPPKIPKTPKKHF
jgi:hypothetical protein